MKNLRGPAVAGMFYPADRVTLGTTVDALLKEASANVAPSSGRVRAVIAPHAGYVFSGAVAADAFAAIEPYAEYERVFIIGPGHRTAFRGAVVDGCCDAYATPLGDIPVDTEVCRSLSGQDSIFHNTSKPFAQEHCIEVQLPFIMRRLKAVPPIVPILIGTLGEDGLERMADALRPYFTPSNLFVISTDFSHYPSYKDAVKVDSTSRDALLTGSPETFLDALRANARLDIPNLYTSACGYLPVTLLLMLMQGSGLDIRHLSYRNSGDSPHGGQDEVVGYHAFSITETEEASGKEEGGFSLSPEEQSFLLRTARQSIEAAFHGRRWSTESKSLSPNLKEECGAFVTITIHGRLRGCIGNLTGSRPLYKTIAKMARAAAFHDPRFRPLTETELRQARLEISVLSPLRRIHSIDEFRLGRDGILIVKDWRSGTFLPQVAEETGWSKEEFLGHCARDKAGLSWDGWKDAELYAYEAEVFHEE